MPDAGARGWSRDRKVDTVWLLTMGGIRSRLRAAGNSGDFDRDASAWRLLRPVAEEFALRRPRLWGDAGPRPEWARDGLLAHGVASLIFARHPREWPLCPGCDGRGRIEPALETCGDCGGAGYRIE